MLKQSHRRSKCFQPAIKLIESASRTGRGKFSWAARKFLSADRKARHRQNLILRKNTRRSVSVSRMICGLADWKCTLKTSSSSLEIELNASTYQHGTLHRIRHIWMQTGSRSSCRSKSYQISSRTVCRRARCDTYCTRSMLHASVCLCSSSPVSIAQI